jgi:hypothetical protein
VIDALTAVTTPLPIAIGTVFRDDSGVRTMMEAREDEFRRTLDRLEGRVEWGVMVYAEVEMCAESESFATRLHETLSSYAEDSRLHIPKGAVLYAAYLVPRSESEEFVEMVDRAKREAAPGTRVELTGPWAAYSFTGQSPPVPATPASRRGRAAHQESQ